MIPVTPNLSEQQICFCDEYLVNFNAFRAAMSAGYSENTARKGELLHTPKIQEYLRMKMQQRTERLEITHDMILREYAKIAFSNMGNYYDERGELKPMCELTETDKAGISMLQTSDITDAEGYKHGTTTKIKMHNKMNALDKIAKHLGFFDKKKQEASFEQVAESGMLKAFEEEQQAVVEREDENLRQKEFENKDTVVLTDAVLERDDVLVDVGAGCGKILTFSPVVREGEREIVNRMSDLPLEYLSLV